MQSIVIVDDETIPRKIAEKALKDKYVVSAYADARTALSELTVTRPNLLLVDLHMPDMDGYAILNEIRQLEDHELSNVPVVIMTSDDDAKNEIKGFDLGAYDYIIIDTPPAIGTLTINALTACNSVIVPAQAEIYSLQGIGQLVQTIQTVKKYCNKGITIKGLLITRYNARAVLTKDMTELLEDTAKQLHTRLYETRIRECIALKEAQASQKDIFTYSPKSNATEDYSAFVEEVLAH